MALSVILQDVVEAMEFQSDEAVSYLNRRNGEVVVVTEEDRSLAELGDDSGLPDWQREYLPKVREALASDDFLELPSKFEIHEYDIMERFSASVSKPALRDALLTAIRGRGAFRYFKDVVHRANVLDEWYRFRQTALEDIARRWLEDKGIPYQERAKGGPAGTRPRPSTK